jgi:hypothetical protein
MSYFILKAFSVFSVSSAEKSLNNEFMDKSKSVAYKVGGGTYIACTTWQAIKYLPSYKPLFAVYAGVVVPTIAVAAGLLASFSVLPQYYAKAILTLPERSELRGKKSIIHHHDCHFYCSLWLLIVM